MNIVKYERFDKDGIELIIDTVTGESFASINGYARMSGKDASTISRRLKGIATESSKTAEILTAQGLRTVVLIPESLIAEWLPKDNPTLTSQLMLLGVRVFMHKLAGYEISSTATKNQSQPSKALMASREISEIHENVEHISPRIAQFLIDCCINEVIEGKSLVGSNDPMYRGVAELAKEMNLPVTEKNRSSLGKFVKSGLSHLAKSEKRLCNGTMQDIATYPDTEEVRGRISLFFSR
jgi:hypothetical protein